jgi:uncharacterized protein
MDKKSDIIKTITQALPKLRANYYVEHIGIFGSYAKASQTPDSDIDFVVKFKEECPDLFGTKNNLKEYLKMLLDKEIDIANEDYIKPYVMESIKSELFYVG